ncbi:MAG TPA: hypothetical protein VFY16_02965, partial [Gemmatimonadaceae bacterium]|nr:hypothetical protein [Gemmatimonadaceae bacterium]
MRLPPLAAISLLAVVAGASDAQQPGRPGAPPRDSTRRDSIAAPDTLARDTLARRDSVPSELGLVLNARLESRAERARDETCSRNPLFNVSTSCQSFFQPTFDFQFDVRGSGTVAERFHVDVNYDSQREFDASNQLSARYEGRPGELLQRIEVGNVFFALPPSRFITGTVPSGNYGIQAVAQLGPWRLRGIAARQQGNVVQDRVFTVGGQSQRAEDRTVDDYELETRRFFFTVDPARFGAANPNIDLLDRAQLAALAASLPDEVRPVRVSVYRLLIGGRPPNPNGPQFRLNGIPTSRRGEIYELLRENVDYYMDASQLWFALVRPVGQAERVVVAYTVRVNGVETTVDSTGGTPDVAFTERDQVANLVWDASVLPGDDAFRREIRSAYRVGGPDVLRHTVQATVTGGDGDQERPPDGRADTYLQLFGLAQRTNPARLDVENRLWPRPADPNVLPTAAGTIPGFDDPAGTIIRDRFLIFPSLQPFAGDGLAGRAGNPTNDLLYTVPSEDLYSDRHPPERYQLRLRYETLAGEGAGVVSLGAVQLRQQSERVTLDGRPLVRGIDYEIDYDIGQLRLLDPLALLVPRRLVVRFEENPIFASIPTSVYGAAAELPLENGRLTFTALGQRQRSSFTRPPLGFEPAGALLAGDGADLAWDAPGISRF